MEKTITFAILGDSAAAGIGDTDEHGVNKGWGYYLTQSFNHPIVYINLSRPGAQSAEVLSHQLPIATFFNPDIAAVIVGGNDALRNGFHPEKFRQNLYQTLSNLTETGTQVLLLQLHDPTKIVKLPKLLGSILLRRINAVNSVTQNLAKEFNLDILQTRRMNHIYDRKVWHIDRMHPSKYGHQLIAQQFREILIAKNWSINPIKIDEIKTTSKLQSLSWMLRKATPWFLKRSVDLLPAAIFLMVAEIIKILFRRDNSVSASIYYPNFSAQSELGLKEVYEERVS